MFEPPEPFLRELLGPQLREFALFAIIVLVVSCAVAITTLVKRLRDRERQRREAAFGIEPRSRNY